MSLIEFARFAHAVLQVSEELPANSPRSVYDIVSREANRDKVLNIPNPTTTKNLLVYSACNRK